MCGIVDHEGELGVESIPDDFTKGYLLPVALVVCRNFRERAINTEGETRN